MTKLIPSARAARFHGPPALPILSVPLAGLLLLGGGLQSCGGGEGPALAAGSDPRAEAPRPDVLVVAVDGLSLDDLSAFGGALAETLGFDRLANEGTVYVETYAPSPWPEEALAAALSGAYAAPMAERMKAEWTPSLAELLGHDGYRCGLVLGHAQHLPPLLAPPAEMVAPTPASFQSDADARDPEAVAVPGFDVTILAKGAEAVAGARADQVAEEAVTWAMESPGPTLLVTTFADPRPPHHLYSGLVPAADVPYDGPMTAGLSQAELLRRRYEFTADDKARLRELHATEVAMADQGFRRLAGAFLTRRPTPPVLVLIGLRPAALGENDRYGMLPSFDPEALRVPMLIRFPQQEAGQLDGQLDEQLDEFQAGRAMRGDVGALASLLDLAPTLLDSLGFEPRYDIEGRSLVPGSRLEARDLFAVTLRGLQGGSLIRADQAVRIQLDPDEQRHFQRSGVAPGFEPVDAPSSIGVDLGHELVRRLSGLGLEYEPAR